MPQTAVSSILELYGVSATSTEPFDWNWKMTAKTSLMQLHHKVETFESIGKHIVLAAQDQLMDYIRRQFRFDHVTGARIGDAVHIHTYRLVEAEKGAFHLEFADRYSTDSTGIALLLGLQASPKVKLEQIVGMLEQKLSDVTLFNPVIAS
jgi:hypothetical protein